MEIQGEPSSADIQSPTYIAIPGVAKGFTRSIQM